MSSSTKNAIDYLYNEWIGKPVMIVTYGIYGGKQASANMKSSFEIMKLRVMETLPQLSFASRPDLYVAAGSGELAAPSLKLWEDTQTEPLLKGFEELVEALKIPAEEAAKEANEELEKKQAEAAKVQ